MTPPFLVIILLVGALLVGELILWRMFRRRVDPVIFPTDHDQSSIGFFRPGRMRFVALCHTIALGVAIVLAVLWLW